MRSLFRRALTAERACRIARRHLDSVCGHQYQSQVEQCRPVPTSYGDAYLVRCEVTGFEWTYDVAVAPNGDVVCVDRYATGQAPAWKDGKEAPRG